MQKYHDEEWGMPKHDDRRLFEDLVLDGAQAGLSWMTILRKRENYREAFDGFDPVKVAAYNEAKIEELLGNAGIIRNRQKINSAIKNAQASLNVQEEFGSFDAYIWGYVDGEPIQNSRQAMSELPAKTDLSEAISKDLKKRGFSFVGPTIIYAFMQAVGLVNDHTIGCFRYHEVAAMV
jgi:DNA-3-methyladenine glycosylase I